MSEENLEMQVHRYIDEVLLLRVENKKLKEKLEKIKKYALSRMTRFACRHILNIIEGAEK